MTESEDKKEQRAREGAKAWADYEAERRALGEKTARLRALRLARDAATKNLTDVKKKRSRTGQQQCLATLTRQQCRRSHQFVQAG